MSFDIVLQSPSEHATDQDRAFAAQAALAVLGPVLDESHRTIVTSDGDAAFYGQDLGSGFMVNHATGEAIWDLLVAVARAAEFVILPVGCGTCIPYEGMRSSVPKYFPDPIVVVRTGADLLAAIGSA